MALPKRSQHVLQGAAERLLHRRLTLRKLLDIHAQRRGRDLDQN